MPVVEGVVHALQCIQSCCRSVFTPSFTFPHSLNPFILSLICFSTFHFLSSFTFAPFFTLSFSLSPSYSILPSHLLHYLILTFSLLLLFSSLTLFFQAEAPLNTIMRLLRHLIPQVAHLTQDQSGADELQIIQFIRRTTMVRQ